MDSQHQYIFNVAKLHQMPLSADEKHSKQMGFHANGQTVDTLSQLPDATETFS